MDMRVTQLIYSDMMGQEFPVEFAITGKIQMKIGKVDEEKQEADIEIKAYDMKYDFGMMAAMMGQGPEMPREFTMKGKINQFGEVTGLAAPQLGAQGGMGAGLMMMLGGGGQQLVVPTLKFPENPLRIGDSWEIPMPPNPMLGMEAQKMKATLVSQRDLDGLMIYNIALKAQSPLAVDMARLMEAQGAAGNEMAGFLADMKISGNMDTSAVVWIEQETGRIVKYETTQKTKQKIDGGMFTADVNGTTVIRINRAKS